ncbi:MAG: hypothetical protein MUC60_08340 [Oscillatoria sp. Prado101]|nr:hypothetical protein [Oscillatoria sp. Prado101]
MIKVLLWRAAANNPFDRDTFDSGHCLWDGWMRQRNNQAHRHDRELSMVTAVGAMPGCRRLPVAKRLTRGWA